MSVFGGSTSVSRDPSARLQDLSFLGPILGVDQALDLANSYPDFGGQQVAWLGSVFKSFAYRYDIRAGLADPMSRTSGRWRLMHRYELSIEFQGRPETMSGLHIDNHVTFLYFQF